MFLPDIQGSCDQSNFFFYAACDSDYFDQFAPALIQSALHNTPYGVHLHVYNATDHQRALCDRPRVSLTTEIVNLRDFQSAVTHLTSDLSESGKDRLRRTQNAMDKGRDRDLLERMMKTYFACARFIRLNEIVADGPVLAIDIDAVVRKSPDLPSTDRDFFIHRIEGRRARYLAGGLWLWMTDPTKKFLSEYANALRRMIERDEIYWGMDQDVLDPIVPKYNHGQLPMSLIDWNMRPESAIWTAKGTRKDLEIFVKEQMKYSL